MKNLLLVIASVLLSLCCGLLLSCDEADNRLDLNASVSTRSLYERFDHLLPIVQDCLQQDDNYLLINVLLYDKNGKYVDSVCTYTKKLDLVEVDLSGIRSGDYTLMSVVTMVHKSNNYQSNWWALSGIEQLSTVCLNSRNEMCPGECLIGVDYKTIKLTSHQSLSIVPEPIGSIVYMMWQGLKNTSYKEISLLRKECPDGYLLNPALSGYDHFIFNTHYDEGQWATLGTSRNIEDVTELTMPVFIWGKDGLLWTWGLKENVNERSYTQISAISHHTIKAGNTYCAYFKYNQKKGSGDVFMGTLKEKETWYEYLTTLFREPCLEWGSGIGIVNKYMTGYQLANKTAIKAGENAYVYVYYPKYKETETDYYFTSATDGLFYSIVFFDPVKVDIDEIREYIEGTDNYTFVGQQQGEYYYWSKDKKTVACVYTNSQGSHVVLYYEYNTSTLTSSNVMKKNPCKMLNNSNDKNKLEK